MALEESAILELISAIDAEVKDRTAVSRSGLGKPQNYVFITADRDGCLSLARMCLAAAASKRRSDGTYPSITLEGRHNQICGASDADIVIGAIRREDVVPIPSEVVARRQREARRRSWGCLATGWIVGIAAFVLMISGIFFWVMMLEGALQFTR